ncbi:transposase [Desulfovibrio sp. DV]|uniref:transposase n=1 Tax=Desulfovibrio sp. DV TaxID=1844708 RepID=UPI0020C9EA8C|nr:transposase [Desulfovibrio sp. DV]
MHLVGYFEGIDSECGIEERCANSLSLRDFLQLSPKKSVPDHSSLSRTRSRLSLALTRRCSPGFSRRSARMAWSLGAGLAWTRWSSPQLDRTP